MKIRIYYKYYRTLMREIRDRVEDGEWDTWKVERVIMSDGSFIRRIVHVPPHDDQYSMIQIKLCLPSKEDVINNEFYLDMIPVVKRGMPLSNKESYNKFAIVMGRWCEVLNKDFPDVSEYHVYLKD